MLRLPRKPLFFFLLFSYYLLLFLTELGDQNFHIGFLVIPFLIGMISYFFTPLDMAKTNLPPVGMTRRYFAALADMLVVIFILFPILALGHVIVQSVLTQTLVIDYGFDKIGNDWEIIPLFAGLIYYFYFHFERGKQTAGQKLLGFEVVHIEGKTPKPWKRIIYGFVAMFFGILTLAAYYHIRNGIYYWDEQSNMRAKRLN